MKVITCASFFGSGSSALTDLVSEYSTVKNMTDFEFRFLYDLDGIGDLEYHLCWNHDRNNSGSSIKRFQKMVNFNSGTFFNRRYEKFFDGKYKELSLAYIRELVELEYDGWWLYDLYDKGKFYYYVSIIRSHLIRKITRGKMDILRKEKTLCSHPTNEKFLKATRNYITALLEAANTEGLPYIELDQIVPSENIDFYLRYFNEDVYVFVIDRDPRDIFISNKYYWNDHVAPKEPNQFCEWFLYTRNHGFKNEYKNKNIIRLNFEDLLFNYEDVVKKIEETTGLNKNDHKEMFQKLNPKRSVHNTQLWKKLDVTDEISIIEEKLKDYLYDFSHVNENVVGLESDSEEVF